MTPKCVVCACIGNEACGHSSPTGDCSLDRAGVCPCYNEAGRHCDGCGRKRDDSYIK
jgi:hypothetical protein